MFQMFPKTCDNQTENFVLKMQSNVKCAWNARGIMITLIVIRSSLRSLFFWSIFDEIFIFYFFCWSIGEENMLKEGRERERKKLRHSA